MTVTTPSPTAAATAATNATADFADDAVARGDRAVLLACDEPRYRTYLAGTLREAALRVHGASGHAAAIARLTSGRPRYTAVVLIENLEGCAGTSENALLQHLASLPGGERRELFVALVGQTLATGDVAGAFAMGVDISVHYRDVGRFADLVFPALEERREAEAAWREAALSAG